MKQLLAHHGRPTVVAVIALACAALMCGAPAALAPGIALKHKTKPALATITPSTPVTPGSDYLALGDSVTFGYQEAAVVPTPDYSNASHFAGYPEMLGSKLHLSVANAACPGETSASLLSATQSNGCENAPKDTGPGYRAVYPLHVKYSGSQIVYAEEYLKSHPKTRLVSLMIGANDLFLCQELTSDACAASSEQAAAAAGIARNVHTILRDIRQTAHYNGQIVVLDYYSLNYRSGFDNGSAQLLNSAEAAGAEGFKVRFANAYNTFETASVHSDDDTCTAQLLTQLGNPTTCGVHPSHAGQTLLAATLENAITIRRAVLRRGESDARNLARRRHRRS